MIALEEDQIELALLVIIEDTLNQSKSKMKEASARADNHYHKTSIREESNQATKDHHENVMDLYKVLLCKSIQSHIDEATFPLIYSYMIQFKRAKAL